MPNRQLTTFAHATLLVLLSWAACLSPSQGWALETPLDPAGIRGSICLVGGGSVPAEVRQAFVDLAGGAEGHLVIIPTASESSDAAQSWEGWTEGWQDFETGSLQVLHIAEATTPSEAELALLQQATAVWFSGGQQSRLSERIVNSPWEKAILGVLERGGVIGGTSAGAAIQSRVMIAGGNPEPTVTRGLDLLPDAIIDQHFQERKRRPRLESAVAANPDRFGIGIDEATAVVVSGRRMTVMGQGQVTLVLAATSHRPSRVWSLKEGENADLTALRRMARNRAGEDFPATVAAAPHVDAGSLLIVGGGRLPPSVTEKFIELAGGEQAHIVVLPTAMPDPISEQQGIAELFRRQGAGKVTVLPQRSREAVESDEFLATLTEATAIWFGGGRQWRFVDAYADTKAAQAFHDVLARGGVIGGSSAGASIQGQYMARGNPLGNLDIMSEGYDRGLGFFPGVAIDQHFTQRSRMSDLKDLVTTYPQFLGIGIDEGTAICVSGNEVQVLGDHAAYFLLSDQPTRPTANDSSEVDPPPGAEAAEPTVHRVASGDRFDLATLTPVVASTTESDD